MENNQAEQLIKIFQKARLEAEPELALSIWHTLILRDKRLTQIKIWVFAGVGFASFVGLFPAIGLLLRDLASSGLYDYFSLLFANGGSLLSYWKELALSLAQSLPTTSLVFTLSLIFVFFLSLRYLLRQIEKNQLMGFATLSV